MLDGWRVLPERGGGMISLRLELKLLCPLCGQDICDSSDAVEIALVGWRDWGVCPHCRNSVEFDTSREWAVWKRECVRYCVKRGYNPAKRKDGLGALETGGVEIDLRPIPPVVKKL